MCVRHKQNMNCAVCVQPLGLLLELTMLLCPLFCKRTLLPRMDKGIQWRSLSSLSLFFSFAGEAQYFLEDEEYRMQYKSEVRDAVMRAKGRPNSLFSGYTFCLSKYIQPSIDVLSSIIKSTGGKVTLFIMPCSGILYA